MHTIGYNPSSEPHMDKGSPKSRHHLLATRPLLCTYSLVFHDVIDDSTMYLVSTKVEAVLLQDGVRFPARMSVATLDK